MALNTSGSIRQGLGRARVAGVKHVDGIKRLLENNPLPWDKTFVADMDGEMILMKKDLLKLEDLWEKWEKFVDRMLDDEDHATEEALYHEWRDKQDYIDLAEDLERYIQKIVSLKAGNAERDVDDRSSSASTQKDDHILDDDPPAAEKRDDLLGDFFDGLSIAERKPVKYITTPIPPLGIPKYNGEYLKWNAFWQIFDVSIHQKNYPKVSKLIALRSLLEGRALEEVDSFTVSAENYDTVVKTLKERFGNPQFLIREFDKKLNALPTAHPNARSIRFTVVAVTNICRKMRNFGMNVDSYSLKNQIINKMPEKERNKLQLMLFNEPLTSMDRVLEKMKEMEIKAELFSPSVSQTTFPPSKSIDKKPWNSFSQPQSCLLCGGGHRPSQCMMYATPNDKVKQLQNKKYCSKCMAKDHMGNDCSRKNLSCFNCNGPHLAFLCLKSIARNNTKAMLSVNRNQSTLLTKRVDITNPDRGLSVPATLFFDSGAQRSYVTNKLVKSLDLPAVNQERLSVQGFGGKKLVYTSDLIKIRIQTVDGFKDIFANSTKKISDHLPVVQKDDVDRYSESKEVPDILIGMDYFYQFISHSKELEPGLFAVDSIVGEMYAGTIPTARCKTVSSLIIDSKMNNVPDQCETFWKLETMGIVDSSKMEEDDKLVQQNFESSVQFKDSRYYVSWPFKANVDRLQSNAGVAIARLRSSAKKIAEDPEFAQQAQSMIADQKKRGTIELAPKLPQGKVVHYLPHHPVFTPEKTTTKVRMVFDGSAKPSTDELCLNDCLFRGPIDMPEIPGLLCRLRKAKILVTGDIEKAFHQVYLNEVDRDAVRFFWLKDFSKPVEPDNLVAYRFVGIPFGKRIQKLLDLLENIFVDNIFLLEDDSEEAVKMFNLVRDCFLEASMNVREWLSNDSTTLKSVPEEIRQNSTVTKVLGLQWDTVADTLSIELKNKTTPKKWTKRNVLKFIAAAYDPLGFLSPVTIKGRIFMQKLFLEELKWDDALPPALVDEWKKIMELWNGSIAFPRRLIQETFPAAAGIEIHVFADASKDAYCAAAYLRIPTPNGFETPLVFAKTRLQPIKKILTIPKMEVMGIWLAAKIGSYVAKEMKVDRAAKFIWTDSQISVCWFKKLPKDVFVANRMKEVLDSKAECLFVPGKMNPADLGTRGIKLDDLRKENIWWNGPEFLKKPREEWPKAPDFGADLTQTVIALVGLSNITETCNFAATNVDRPYPVDEDISWDELKKQVARAMKKSDDVQVEDMNNAERAIIIQEQEIYVKSIDVKQLKLVKDDEGIYRTHYRFDHAELLNANPVFIPKKSPVAKMICLDTHKKLQHAGTPHTLSKIREKYWIPSGRATVIKCINICVDCKYWRSKPFSLPQMPQLPASRVVRSKPFQNVGIDYCGPFKVKEKAEKIWIILFTCFGTRLIHLEHVSTMTSEDFLLSFRKFVARRGAPHYILSDNAKQFKTAANALEEIWKKAIKDEKSIDYMLKNDICWDFITERAPWKGGLYERLVALVKNSLKICVGKKSINLNEFSALLCEIESTLNTRPLTYVHGKESFVIRPADFIYPSIALNMPTTADDNQSTDPSYMPSNVAGGEVLAEKYFKSLQHVDRFWKLWANDYLNMLRERNGGEHKNARGAQQRNPVVGEYVLVSEADTPRGSWKIAKIVDVIQSADKEIRSCEIQYVDGFITRRAINHLYPLEEGAVYLDISTENSNPTVANNENMSL
uniref:Integrase catalytic domain-containing protein n=1 Tax=Panagrolaimus sp. ES5 TaxID=591445 RepID=A0AC34GU52_9BILA